MTRRTVDHVVAVGKELHAGEHLRAVHRHGAGGALEHCEVTRPRLIHQTVGVGPVGTDCAPRAIATIDHAVGKGLAAVPITNFAGRRRHLDVDLIGHAGLHHQIAEAITERYAGDIHPQIGQGPGVVEQTVHTDAETASIADVEIAVEGEVAADLHQRGGRWCAQRHIDVAAGCEGQRTRRQLVARRQRQMPVAIDVDGAERRTGAGQGAAAVDVDLRAGQRTTETDGAAIDRGVAGDAVDTGEVQGAGADFDQAAATAEIAVEVTGDAGAPDGQGVAGGQLHTAAAGQCTEAGVAAQVQPGTGVDVDAVGIAQRVAVEGGNAAGQDVQCAGESVVTCQRQV